MIVAPNPHRKGQIAPRNRHCGARWQWAQTGGVSAKVNNWQQKSPLEQGLARPKDNGRQVKVKPAPSFQDSKTPAGPRPKPWPYFGLVLPSVLIVSLLTFQLHNAGVLEPIENSILDSLI